MTTAFRSIRYLLPGCLLWATAAVLLAQPGSEPADAADEAAQAGQPGPDAPDQAAQADDPDTDAADEAAQADSGPGAPNGAAAAGTGGPASAAADSWFETRLAIMDLAEAGDYEAVLALAPRLLERAEEEFGMDSAGVAETRRFLASVYRGGGNHLAAEENIIEAISIYERTEGPLSVTLIDPYLELGDNYQEASDHAGAITAYNEARTIGRRAYGLLNHDQLTIIDRMSKSAAELGNFDEANGLQIEALTLVERTHGELSPEALEARYKYAGWLRGQRRFQDERQQYYQILRIAERHFEDQPLMQVRALRERANSFRAERQGDSLGLSGLRQALDIVRKLPQPNPLAHAEVLRDMGDWDVAFSRSGSSGGEYVEAWRLLGLVDNGDALRKQWFDELVIINLAPLSLRGLTTDPDAPRGRVEARFTIDTTGQAVDVEITQSYPRGFKDAAALRQIRSSRFRPKVENGELVASRRALRIDFQYEPSAVGR